MARHATGLDTVTHPALVRCVVNGGRHRRTPYAQGFRDGMLSAIDPLRAGSAPVRVSRVVGSPTQDALTRLEDAERFARDVQRAAATASMEHRIALRKAARAQRMAKRALLSKKAAAAKKAAARNVTGKP